MINKGENGMNDLNCKKCDKVTTGHDDDVIAVTCSICSMLGVVDLLDGYTDDDGTIIELDSNIVGEA